MLSAYGERTFCVTTLTVYSLPEHLRDSASSLHYLFRRYLKTYLFARYQLLRYILAHLRLCVCHAV